MARCSELLTKLRTICVVRRIKMKTIIVNHATARKDFPALNQTVLVGPEEMDAYDGYHTFNELYDHRITLFIALARQRRSLTLGTDAAAGDMPVWRSKRHSDGELCFGTGTQFVLGIYKEPGRQITYHVPIERWSETTFAETLEIAPEWDGHSSADVLERLKQL